MKRLFSHIILLAIACGAAQSQNVSIAPTTLYYDVNWKWGLVDISVGQATVNLECSNGQLSGTLGGHSIPWEGRVYSVQDTLVASVSPQSQDISYINGYYRKPKANSHTDVNNPLHYVNILGEGSLNASPSTMEAVSITANMIGLFYYAKAIDFGSMADGEVVNVPISAPYDNCQSLAITYQGTGTSDDGKPTYNIIANYTYNGRPSGYPIECQIDQDSRDILYIASTIRIGHVKMTLID